MTERNTTLTPQEYAALEKNMSNPLSCLSDALFYAHCTGQYATADMLIETGQEISRLFIELHDEGLVPSLEAGTGSLELQNFASANVSLDPRFAKIVELAKTRFLVELREVEAEDLMENVRDTMLLACDPTPGRVLN